MMSYLVFFNGEATAGDPTMSVGFGALLMMLLIFTLGIFYKSSLKKADSYEQIPKAMFIVFLMISWVKMNTMKLLGKKNKFAIPFFMYIMLYFWASGMTNMLGLTGILNFLIVPITLSAFVFLGILFFSIKAKGWGFCTDYFMWMSLKKKGKKILPIPDVLAILGELGKMASLALSLWGNYFAGTLFMYIFGYAIKPYLGGIGLGQSIITSVLGLPLTLYFDVVDTVLHSMMFLFLTITYWSLASKSLHK